MSFNYFILTIPHADFLPYLPPQCSYIRGQLELGELGFLHYQVVVQFVKKIRIPGVKKVFGDRVHVEPTRSEAALEYVWKQETRIDGTQFELGTRKIRRSDPTDWDAIRGLAIRGELQGVPSDIFVRSYLQLSRICSDYAKPVGVERICAVYWGPTGLGKSRRAWWEAGIHAYPKDPNTKFWDGYQNNEHVVIDEFRGLISISNILRWCDRYPVQVEIKGSSRVLSAKKLWITSNLHPEQWYPGLDNATFQALIRRLIIVEFSTEWIPPVAESTVDPDASNDGKGELL